MKYLYIALFLLATSIASAQYSGIVTSNGTKNVLLEISRGASCGYAPDADVYINHVFDSVKDVIPVCIHSNITYADAMGTSAGTTWEQTYTTGCPMGTVDRITIPSVSTSVEVDRTLWVPAATARKSALPDYDVTMSYSINMTTRVINVVVKGKALRNLTGDYRLNVFVIEDSVSGSGTGYDQRNYYGSTTGHLYFGQPDPIPGFYHRHVLREMLGGVWGTPVVTNPSVNAVSAQSYSYTVPTGYNINKIRLVGMVMKYNTANINDREILNITSTPYTSTPAPEHINICVVGRDSATNKNIVVWEKGGINRAKMYKIYREDDNVIGQYNLIDTQSASAFSTFIDTGSHPDVRSYRYKLTLVDTFGQELILDSVTPHRTILVSSVTTTTSIILKWNLYEGKPNTVAHVMESVNGGTFTSIAILPPGTTTYTITSSASGGTHAYRIDIEVPNGCAPSKSTGYNFISSNVIFPFPVSINNIPGYNDLIVSPNPASDNITVNNTRKGDVLRFYNMIGVLQKQYIVKEGNITVNVGDLSTGMYVLNVLRDNVSIQRISVQIKN
ncbi:MAG: hypothetical protein BGO70_17815 [Bacteroidetes bacterium 43-93]|nr:Omp28-related outer membrane protein [Bacteroidota bacterium]OJX01598.1 MAG: hypothetical protein BGO70_17815 [Bacteroidetes bacterium 43-93]